MTYEYVTQVIQDLTIHLNSKYLGLGLSAIVTKHIIGFCVDISYVKDNQVIIKHKNYSTLNSMAKKLPVLLRNIAEGK